MLSNQYNRDLTDGGSLILLPGARFLHSLTSHGAVSTPAWAARELEIPEGIKLADPVRGRTPMTQMDEYLGLVVLATKNDLHDPVELYR